jgi:hypothetical protein
MIADPYPAGVAGPRAPARLPESLVPLTAQHPYRNSAALTVTRSYVYAGSYQRLERAQRTGSLKVLLRKHP